MTADLSLTVVIALAAFGFIGGVGITAVGPGGVLPTIALFALTDLTPAQVAGTAIVTHIATGALATAAYTRSGQLRKPATRRTARLLSAAAVAGTPVGVTVNTIVSERVFGLMLATFVVGVAGLLWIRDHEDRGDARPHPSTFSVAALGFTASMAAGIVGIGGPMLTVPLLIALGTPILESLAAAQAQSIVIATVGAVGYLAHGAIDWSLAAVVGIPELAGVLLGWKIAHVLPSRGLKYALIISLLALGPYLAWQA
ncbi:sulfite exporter TauE/SafE family protein [Mycobacterium sp. 21AC1]|uniref:sulfite exporter TauE/SafE family protein n=1 Tax=[Mycobacterium] appelbergii TaxID=2939269 RepID=UPI0029390800|nr:sulfite exporter TauE/SafE family protein [Mycobacterium sp. 21AC1]MDV3128610.1 sulfite exporter TauE/SafE family protein [Mycobacterium sp. 21AC1]